MRRWKHALAVTAFLFFLTAPVAQAGTLVVIGGRLEPENADVYSAILDAVGGPDQARVAVIPAASATPDTSGNSYLQDFIDYGVRQDNCRLYPVAVKDDPDTGDVDESTWSNGAWDEALAADATTRNVFFFTGGDQDRILTCLIAEDGTESPLLGSIRGVLAGETPSVVSGSSAGAAIMSDPMIVGGDPLMWVLKGPDSLEDADQGGLGQGLGFMDDGIADQHFLVRGRLGRLVAACLENGAGQSTGIGVDENTAFVLDGGEISVVGETGAFVVDTSDARWNRVNGHLAVTDVRLHFLDTGDRMNLATGAFTPAEGKSLIAGPAYGERPLETDLFGAYTFMEMVTKGLIDSSADTCTGLAFSVDIADGAIDGGSGTRWTFRKTSRTEGYKGTARSDFPLSGGSHPHLETYTPYSALNVLLDIQPFAVTAEQQ